MKLLIDRRTARLFKFINVVTDFNLPRRYYEHPGGTLLRLDDGLALEQIIHRVVEAQIGSDIAQPGFTLNEACIGSQRTKITVRRVIRDRYELTLSHIVEAEDETRKREHSQNHPDRSHK